MSGGGGGGGKWGRRLTRPSHVRPVLKSERRLFFFFHSHLIRSTLCLTRSSTSSSLAFQTRRRFLTSSALPPSTMVSSSALVRSVTRFCWRSLLTRQTPRDANGDVVPGDIQALTTQCVRNLEQVLIHAGSSLKKVLKVNVFLDDMDDFDEMNKAYEKVRNHPYTS